MGRRPGPFRRDHRNTDWMDQAACAEAPTELFHPEGPDEWSGRQRVDPARVRAYHERNDLTIADYCLDCPVQASCREYGKDEEFGIWGGLTEGDRRAERTTHEPYRGGRDVEPSPSLRMRLVRLRQARTFNRLIGAT